MDSARAQGRRPRIRIGWLSGVSRPGSVALSPEQRDFLNALPGEAGWKLGTNFPYADGSKCEPFQRTALPAASVVNGWRFVASSLPFRRQRLVAAWEEFRSSADTLLLVTLSTGSQMAQAFEKRVSKGVGRARAGRLALFSMGAVDWGCPAIEQHRLRGERDSVARPFARTGDEILPGAKHLDYARSEEARARCAAWMWREFERDGVVPGGES